MLFFWDDPKSQMVGIDLIGEQIILQPSLIHFQAKEAEARPIVITVPRSLDVASLGRVTISLLSLSEGVNRELPGGPIFRKRAARVYGR